jgi:hypothetical protein
MRPRLIAGILFVPRDRNERTWLEEAHETGYRGPLGRTIFLRQTKAITQLGVRNDDVDHQFLRSRRLRRR